VITLGVADLVLIAGRVLGLGTEEVLDLLDPEGAGQALTGPWTRTDPTDPAAQAAALLCALVRGAPLRHGNQPVALAATLQFLALNGWNADTSPPRATAAVVTGIAAGTLDPADVARWLAPRLQLANDQEEKTMRERPALSRAGRLKFPAGKSPDDRLRRFTDRARRAVDLAGDEARRLGHGYVGTEHLLLGLLREGKGIAPQALELLGLSPEEVRRQVTGITGTGPGLPSGHVQLTPQARRVLKTSLQETLALGHQYVGTEHLLLALLRERRGVAAQVLTKLGADYDRAREQVETLLDQRQGAGREAGNQAIVTENQQLRREVARLHGVLREHGIDPDSGTAQTA
jgi:hypothetical protein